MTKAMPLPARRSAVTASTAPRGRLVADPYAAVEVEQRMVVAAEKRRKGHGGWIILRRRVATPRAGLAIMITLAGTAGCGADKEGKGRTTATVRTSATTAAAKPAPGP